ncbi:arginine/serine-rich coiled-coil protein 2 isoform X2 [Tetranychus urticae]|nr:arginine/serine-rich coiled-coil protein 2 isoform X2 [Tetranychus urticae]
MNPSNDENDSTSRDKKDIIATEGDKKVYNSDDRNVEEKNSQCEKSDASKKHQNDTFDSKISSRNDKVPYKNRSSHKSSRRSRSRSHEDDRHRRKDDQRDYRRSYRSNDKHYRDTRKEESRDFSRSDRDRRKSDREHEDSKNRYSRDSKSSSGRRINHRDYKDHHSSDNRSFRESRDISRLNSSDFLSKEAHTKRHENHSKEGSSAKFYDDDEARREENSKKSSSIHPLPSVSGDFVDGLVNKDKASDTSYSSPSSTFPASQPSLSSSSLTASTTSANVPRYYKQATFNATKYAIQEEKKKLLWSSTKKDDSQSKETPKVWHGLQFSGAQGQQMTEKFLKLMGSKTTTAPDKIEDQDSMVKYQENLFKDLDKQYSLARMSTHTHRGIGLGFSSHPSPK